MAHTEQSQNTNILDRYEYAVTPHKIGAHEGEPQREARGKKSILIGKEYGLSKASIERYLKLNDLYDSFLGLVDSDAIGAIAAYNLAFISKETQRLFLSL